MSRIFWKKAKKNAGTVSIGPPRSVYDRLSGVLVAAFSTAATAAAFTAAVATTGFATAVIAAGLTAATAAATAAGIPAVATSRAAPGVPAVTTAGTTSGVTTVIPPGFATAVIPPNLRASMLIHSVGFSRDFPPVSPGFRGTGDTGKLRALCKAGRIDSETFASRSKVRLPAHHSQSGGGDLVVRDAFVLGLFHHDGDLPGRLGKKSGLQAAEDKTGRRLGI